ncbi:MAG TPA: hypothetical protein VGR03_09785 [Candidatus Acidoferrum sp.]|nr:hypothetical protein [Candidatus Acidoferrum sp.]
MTSDKQASEPHGEGEGRRRGGRFPVLVSVAVRWEETGGKAMKAEAHAREVNIFGGLLQFLDTEVYPAAGVEMELTNLFSGEEARARTAAVRRTKGGAMLGVAVELLIPSETFWGLTFRLRKTTAELVRLDQAIKSGNIDPRVLREFRDAVDYVRKTAWAVQEWQERQAQHHDTATVLPLLVTERVRRATQLCAAVAKDLKESEITSQTAGIEKLFRASEQLSRDLAELHLPGPDN